MSAKAAPVSQEQIAMAVAGLREQGVAVARVEIRTSGRVVIIAARGKPLTPPPVERPLSVLEQARADRAKRAPQGA